MFDEIVANCPVCNAPIYGRKMVEANSYNPPAAKFTCDCRTYLLARIQAETNAVNARAYQPQE